MEGDWSLDDDGRLAFFRRKNQVGLLTNTLMINSKRTKFLFKFSTYKAELQEVNKKLKRRGNSEVFSFTIGNRLYDINTYSKTSTVTDAMGVSLIFLTPKGSKTGKAYLRELRSSSKLYNLQAIFKTKMKKKYICDVDYLNTETKVEIDFNFNKKIAIFKINEQVCFEYPIRENAFPENKVSYTFFGYTKRNNPIVLAFSDILVKKLMSKDLKKNKNKSFHFSPKNVVEVQIILHIGIYVSNNTSLINLRVYKD